MQEFRLSSSRVVQLASLHIAKTDVVPDRPDCWALVVRYLKKSLGEPTVAPESSEEQKLQIVSERDA
jgi:hypothetical protein